MGRLVSGVEATSPKSSFNNRRVEKKVVSGSKKASQQFQTVHIFTGFAGMFFLRHSVVLGTFSGAVYRTYSIVGKVGSQHTIFFNIFLKMSSGYYNTAFLDSG